MPGASSTVANPSTTKILYFTNRSVTPFMSTINKRIGEIRLIDFKNLFDRPGFFRYHFKAVDQEFGMVKEEVSKNVRCGLLLCVPSFAMMDLFVPGQHTRIDYVKVFVLFFRLFFIMPCFFACFRYRPTIQFCQGTKAKSLPGSKKTKAVIIKNKLCYIVHVISLQNSFHKSWSGKEEGNKFMLLHFPLS